MKDTYRQMMIRVLAMIGKIVPDKLYLKMKYLWKTGKRLNLESPSTYNEKLQWLKLNDRNPLYTELVDKYAVRKYIADMIGEQYLIPLVGGPWNLVAEIDFESLPEQFVLKCTHDSGGIVICKDKSKLDYALIRKKMGGYLKTDYYARSREWPYKHVTPRIIAEKYMVDAGKEQLTDYKFMCFDGCVKCTFVCENRNTEGELKITFYDRQWQIMPVERVKHGKSNIKIDKPTNYEKMVELAEKLSENMAFLRVDFYEVNGKIYFGELTFYPASGFEGFNPPKWDKIFGDWLILPKKRKENRFG